MKRMLAILLTLLVLLSAAACQANVNDADMEAMKLQLQRMQQQLDAAAESASAQQSTVSLDIAAPGPAEDESGDPVLVLHATIDGQTSLLIDGAVEFTATAEIPEGMAVDYWELNGAQYHEDMEDTFTFTAQGATVVDARLRPEHKVSAINAEMQFLDQNGKPKGDAFTEFVFEEDYEHPLTHETLPGGWITVNVNAVVPKGRAVDYWLINDVPYYYNRAVSSFTVHDLNETTVYEVVLKNANAPSSEPKPGQTSNNQSTPTEVKYRVSCTDCTFSGGGYVNAGSGSVPAGTRITVTTDLPGLVFWEGSNGNGDKWHAEPKSFSYTVNRDCSFTALMIVN